MPDDISADRVTAIATAARVPLAPIDAGNRSRMPGHQLRPVNKKAPPKRG
jgi:hypothetical protein